MPKTVRRKPPAGGTAVSERAPRQPVQVPEEWMALLKRVAAKQKQPHTWVLLELIAERARELGFEQLPPFPWDVEPSK